MTDFITADSHLGHSNIVLHTRRTPWIYPNPDFDPSKPYHFKNNNPDAVDIKAHDEMFIERWNKRVSKNDRVYILGDFAYNNHRKYILALNGKKVLIKGNHDKMSWDCLGLWKEFDINNGIANNVKQDCSSLLKRFKNGDIDLLECQQSIMISMWSKFMQIQNFEDIDQMSNACYNQFEGVHEMGCRKRIDGHDITLSHYAMRSWASSVHGSGALYGHSHGRLPEFDNMFCFDVGVDVWDYSPIPWEAVITKMRMIQDKINQDKGTFVDGESAAKGLYSQDPEQRVKDTRKKNLQILKDIGINVEYEDA